LNFIKGISNNMSKYRYRIIYMETIMEMRTCKYCSEDHPLETYDVAVRKEGKILYRRWRCTKCQTASKRARKHKLREWFDELKKTFECKSCGEDKFYMLDLHHRDPKEKEISLGDAVRRGWSKDRMMKEIKKCDVLCSNHHRELHYENKITG